MQRDVHVVVFDALVGGVGVVADAGADSPDLVGGDGRADSAAAYHYAALGLAGCDGFGDGLGEVGEVVRRVEFVSADVHNLVSQRFDVSLQFFFQWVSPVVGPYDYAHIRPFL